MKKNGLLTNEMFCGILTAALYIILVLSDSTWCLHLSKRDAANESLSRPDSFRVFFRTSKTKTKSEKEESEKELSGHGDVMSLLPLLIKNSGKEVEDIISTTAPSTRRRTTSRRAPTASTTNPSTATIAPTASTTSPTTLTEAPTTTIILTTTSASTTTSRTSGSTTFQSGSATELSDFDFGNQATTRNRTKRQAESPVVIVLPDEDNNEGARSADDIDLGPNGKPEPVKIILPDDGTSVTDEQPRLEDVPVFSDNLSRRVQISKRSVAETNMTASPSSTQLQGENKNQEIPNDDSNNNNSTTTKTGEMLETSGLADETGEPVRINRTTRDIPQPTSFNATEVTTQPSSVTFDPNDMPDTMPSFDLSKVSAQDNSTIQVNNNTGTTWEVPLNSTTVFTESSFTLSSNSTAESETTNTTTDSTEVTTVNSTTESGTTVTITNSTEVTTVNSTTESGTTATITNSTEITTVNSTSQITTTNSTIETSTQTPAGNSTQQTTSNATLNGTTVTILNTTTESGTQTFDTTTTPSTESNFNTTTTTQSETTNLGFDRDLNLPLVRPRISAFNAFNTDELSGRNKPDSSSSNPPMNLPVLNISIHPF